MYKVMVVDDEVNIKEWIENMISSVDSECIVLNHRALNGSEALKIFDIEKPDIVFTDIIMPVLDGVELVKELRKRSETVKIVVLSNYNDFQYVKETLSSGASDYLLKLEARPADLKKIIDKVKTEIKYNQKKMEEVFRLKISLNSNLNNLKEKYMRDAVSGSDMKKVAMNRLTKEFNMNIIDKKPTILALRIDNTENELESWVRQDFELLKFAVINVCEETINPLPGGITAFLNNDFISILTINEKDYNYEYIKNLCMNIQQNLFEYMKLTVSLGIGISEEGHDGLERQYEQALKALKFGFYSDLGSIINYRDIDTSAQQQDLTRLKDYVKEILEIFENKDFNEFTKVLQNVAKHLRVCRSIDPKELKEILKVLIHEIEASLKSMTSNSKDYSVAHKNIYDIIEKSNHIDQLVAGLERHVQFLEEVLKNNFRRYSPPIRSAIEYIRNYFGSDITRLSIAEYVHLNESYFSELFNKEVGQSFSNYLTMVRIEAAKKLLINSELSISEISFKVGYSNQSYFAKLFKNITGRTPMQFKEQKKISN